VIRLGTPEVARPLFAQLRHHASVDAILAGDEPGDVYADDSDRPSVALLLGHNPHRICVGGSADRDAFNRAAADLLAERRRGAVIVYHDGGAWASSVASLVPGAETAIRQRRYLRMGAPRVDWPTPDGVAIRRVDRALLDERLGGADELVEEIGSESPSVEAFLATKFGFAAQHGRDVVGFCLSEYNRPGRCELGVATLDPHRRRGVATALASATVAEARSFGFSEVGWHCWADNASSVGLALKLGFEVVTDYSVWLCR
jgi:GNAT superfamily N-acetyltransferase